MKTTSVSDCFTIQNNYKHYDFKKCLSFIEYKGKQDYGQNFKIKEEDLETICTPKTLKIMLNPFSFFISEP